MVYLLSTLVASLVVIGQLLWKVGIERYEGELTINVIFSKEIIHIFLNPIIILGFFTYGIATLLYMLLLDKFDYTLLQSLIIPLSLVLALFAATLIFKERMSFINYIGIALIITGVILAVRR